MMLKKGYLQISFAWLFAIIVGAFILFLAIYGTTKVANLGQYQISTETAKKIGVLLNPLETGFETGKTTSLSLNVDTRIYTKCDEEGDFGRQIIRISQKSFGKWPEPAGGVPFKNKYIFSSNVSEGKKFYIFSKPFEFPFKVSDLIYLTSSQQIYCFFDPPESIEKEISDLKQENLLLGDSCLEKGVKQGIKVCFDTREQCDVTVKYEEGVVEKKGDRLNFYEDALMYAAIFGDKQIYECQFKRLMKRTKQLTLMYADKANFLSQKKCYSNLNQDLMLFANNLENVENSEDVDYLINNVENIRRKNDISYCKLW